MHGCRGNVSLAPSGLRSHASDEIPAKLDVVLLPMLLGQAQSNAAALHCFFRDGDLDRAF